MNRCKSCSDIYCVHCKDAPTPRLKDAKHTLSKFYTHAKVRLNILMICSSIYYLSVERNALATFVRSDSCNCVLSTWRCFFLSKPELCSEYSVKCKWTLNSRHQSLTTASSALQRYTLLQITLMSAVRWTKVNKQHGSSVTGRRTLLHERLRVPVGINCPKPCHIEASATHVNKAFCRRIAQCCSVVLPSRLQNPFY